MSNNNTLWWVLLASWMVGSTWWHVCNIKQICDAPLSTHAEEPIHAETHITPLHIMDGSALMLTSPGHFVFEKSGAEADLSAVKSELDSLVEYLRAKPDRNLNIKGFYNSSETNTTQWPDLGIARAENVKSYLISLGISKDRLTTSSEMTDDLAINNNKVNGGIAFDFFDLTDAITTSLAKEQKFSDIFKPLDLYFHSGSIDYIRTTDNENFLAEAKKFLNDNKDKKLLLTGHTDNTGTVEGNQQLSNDRAEQIKALFEKAGIKSDKLMVEAKGQSSPKASNNTEDGKAANRRVTIIVK